MKRKKKRILRLILWVALSAAVAVGTLLWTGCRPRREELSVRGVWTFEGDLSAMGREDIEDLLGATVLADMPPEILTALAESGQGAVLFAELYRVAEIEFYEDTFCFRINPNAILAAYVDMMNAPYDVLGQMELAEAAGILGTTAEKLQGILDTNGETWADYCRNVQKTQSIVLKSQFRREDILKEFPRGKPDEEGFIRLAEGAYRLEEDQVVLLTDQNTSRLSFADGVLRIRPTDEVMAALRDSPLFGPISEWRLIRAPETPDT